MKCKYVFILISFIVLTGCDLGTKKVISEASYCDSDYNSFITQETEISNENTVNESGGFISDESALQSPSATDSNIAKPDKTVSQIREQPKTSSAAPSKTDTAQTPPETRAETPANATAADTKAVADRVIYYLNKTRADIGSGELKRLPRLTVYAEYRSSQLPSNFAHDISDWFAAAKATGYGRYTEMPDGSGSYDIGAQEAIAMAGVVGSADKIGRQLAQIIIDSSRHWSYVGSDEMKYTGVGVTSVDDLWYTAIMVTTTDEYEK